MVKKKIITINGDLGSGKSSAAKGAAKVLNFEHFSSGDFFRQVGLELGLSINEINKKAETSPEIDKKTDEKLRQMKDREKIVIDSRIAYYWIPESFKVYLTLPPEIAQNRILNSIKENKLREQSEQSSSVEEVFKKIHERFESEQKRYWDLYKINNTDKNNYDIVIDTNKNDLEQTINIIVSAYRQWIRRN